MSVWLWVSLMLAVLIAVYLVVALLKAENFS
jgi:K+-transporting ATPase KdpF subunit